MKDLVEIVSYDERWPEIYSEEVQPIQEVLSLIVVEAHHIGSTSVPELSAKPVIDIMILVDDLMLMENYDKQMTAIGYVPKGSCGVLGRCYFDKDIERDGAIKVNVHVYEYGDPQALRQLWFRDYLSEHPSDRDAYAVLKKSLANRFPYDIISYVLGKSSFVQKTDHKALEWKALKGEHFIAMKPKKLSWTEQQKLKAIDENFQLQMTFFARYLPSSNLIVHRDTIVHRSTIPDHSYNFAIATHFSEDKALRRVRDIMNYFIEQNLPFTWWVGHLDEPEHLGELIQSQGLQHKENRIGMSRPLEDSPSIGNGDLDIRRVVNHRELKDFDRVYVEAGGSPDVFDLLYNQIPSILYQEGSPIELYTAYLNEEPVAIGSLCLYANAAGIYHIATVPQQSAEGVSDMLDFLIGTAAQKGYSLATTVTPEKDKELFIRKGFTENSVYRGYHPL